LCVAVLVAAILGYALRPSSSSATKAALAHPHATLTSLTDPSSQEFSGEVTDAACGTTDFTVHPASTVNVTVTAATPTNDLMVDLWYGGQIVHNEDTGVGQETFTYSVDDTAGGTYTVEVCKSGNPATPFMPAGGPYPYDGIFTDVDIAKQFGAGVPLVRIDSEQIRRVIINVVDNAIEAVDRQGKIAIETCYDESNHLVRMVVADDGPGIPPGEREKLFLPYYSTKRRGSGLGLAIVRRIIAEHGGSIEAGDNQPHGTRFTIELPC